MRSYITAFVLALTSVPRLDAFMLTPQATQIVSRSFLSSRQIGKSPAVLCASSIGDQEVENEMDMEEALSLVPPEMLMREDEMWQKQLQSAEIQEIRREMVAKYTSLGKSLECAEAEVDEFLNDREKSQQYLEMRRYSQAQVEDMTMSGGLGQLILAFFIGLMATLGPKIYAASQLAN